MRLNAYLASRHKADELIKVVSFTVNGDRAAEYVHPAARVPVGRPRYRHDR
jgi:hypothetical protein